MSSRPRDSWQPPKFTALIPREPEVKWVGSRPGTQTKFEEEFLKLDTMKMKESQGGETVKKSFANGIKSLCIYVPRISELPI